MVSDEKSIYTGALVGFFTGVCVSVGIAIGVGRPSVIKETKPKQVYLAMLNDDEKQDVIITNGKEERYIFLSQPDGTYRNLDDIQKDLDKANQEDSTRFRETIEAKVENAISSSGGE